MSTEERLTTLPPHAPPTESTRSGVYYPTFQDMKADSITHLAETYWNNKDPTKRVWDPLVIERIYTEELEMKGFEPKKLTLLELSQYLEKYLWPNFEHTEASLAHVLSIVLMVNEKFRERVAAWDCFMKSPEQFPGFFKRVLELSIPPLANTLSPKVRKYIVLFLIRVFQSIENPLIRGECMILVSLVTWHCFGTSSLRDQEFANNKDLKKMWNVFAKKFKKADESQRKKIIFERTWLSNFMKAFVEVLYTIPEDGGVNNEVISIS
ncbi:unnamed protein product [Rhizophagus irregularis]|nr:unnamed protein product [Rhizophagus irregularis]